MIISIVKLLVESVATGSRRAQQNSCINNYDITSIHVLYKNLLHRIIFPLVGAQLSTAAALQHARGTQVLHVHQHLQLRGGIDVFLFTWGSTGTVF